MKRLRILSVALALALVAVGVAVGVVWANHDDTASARGPGMMAAGSASAPGWWDDESWGSMMGGQTDVASEQDYLVEMVAHHRDAITAARELARSDRPQMRDLGESIVSTQSAQVEQMESWLASWYPDQPTTGDYEPMMRDLSGLSGDELDRTFLEDMVGHHMAAVMMSQRLLFHGTEHEQVATLAERIRDDQHAEIITMQGWLARWFDESSFGMPGMGDGTMMGQGRS
jgi:uncharacterized protein (DUF305 family)